MTIQAIKYYTWNTHTYAYVSFTSVCLCRLCVPAVWLGEVSEDAPAGLYSTPPAVWRLSRVLLQTVQQADPQQRCENDMHLNAHHFCPLCPLTPLSLFLYCRCRSSRGWSQTAILSVVPLSVSAAIGPCSWALCTGCSMQKVWPTSWTISSEGSHTQASTQTSTNIP